MRLAIPEIVASGKLAQVRAFGASHAGLGCCAGLNFRGAAHVLPASLGALHALSCADADKVTFHVGQAAEDIKHQAAGAGIGPRLGQ